MNQQLIKSISLPATPVAYINESPGSLLLRASSKNGWPTPLALIRAFSDDSFKNKSVDNIIKNTSVYQNVLSVFGIPFNASNHIGYDLSWVDHKYCIDFNGIIIPPGMLRDKEAAYCPKCIDEDGHMPSHLDYRLVTACSKHKTELVTQCPSCRSPLTWNRSSFNTCSCCNEKLDSETPRIVNVEGTKVIERFLEQKEQHNINLLHAYSTALIKFYRYQLDSYPTHQVCHLAAEGVIKPNGLTNELTKEVITSTRHPRIALYGFLGSTDKRVSATGKEVLLSLDSEYSNKNISASSEDDVLISITEASSTLGISIHLTKQLISKSIIVGGKQRHYSPWEISLNSIDALFNKLASLCQNDIAGINALKLINNPNESIAFSDVILKILSGEFISGHFSFSGGLSALTVINRPGKRLLEGVDRADYLTLKEMAVWCDTNYASIQKVAKTNLIAHSQLDKNPRLKLIKKSVVDEFNETYVIASSLAKTVGGSQTTFANKLMSCGVLPVSGPTVDNCGVYVFRRKDYAHLDLNMVVKADFPPHSVGRPRKDAIKKRYTGISFSTVAEKLGISHQTVIALIYKGLLNESTDTYQKKAVTPMSFENLVKRAEDPSYSRLDDALEDLNINYQEFYKIYIQTNKCKVIDLVFTQLINKHDLKNARKINQKYITANEAGVLARSHRSFLPNLEKGGRIHPMKILKGKQFNIKLYDRNDAMKLISQHNQHI